MPTNTICLESLIAIPLKAHGIAFRSQRTFLALLFVLLGGGLMSRCVVVAIHFRFSSSSFSLRSTPLHRHNTISMHLPSSPSSALSVTSRPSHAVYLLLIVSVCCTIGRSLHFTHSHVHSCLPSHAGSFDAPTPQDFTRTLAISSTSRDASVVVVVSETRHLRTITSPKLITGDDSHQSFCQSHGITILLSSSSQRPCASVSPRSRLDASSRCRSVPSIE
jgi:hypothetical protein